MSTPDAEIRLFLGGVGFGKSYRLERVVREMAREGYGIALIAYPHFSRNGEPVDASGERVWTGAMVWPSVDRFRAAWEIAALNVFPQGVSPMELAALAVELGGRGERVMLVVDELDRLTLPGLYLDDPPVRKGAPYTPGATRRIVNEGRHVGVSLVGGARKPTALHDEVAANARRIYIFNLTGRAALGWVDEVCGPAYRERCPMLARGAYMLWQPGPPSDATHSHGEPRTFR